MKSKLTLRVRDSVKAEAKAIAAQRGTSVSQMVETYFQMLADYKSEGAPQDGSEGASEEANLTTEGSPTGDAPDAMTSGPPDDASERDTLSKRTVDLSPRIQALQATLGQPAPDVDLDADTRQWVDHAAKKHA
jgi:hypothetical protein